MQSLPRAYCDMEYLLVWIRRNIHYAAWQGLEPCEIWIKNRNDTFCRPIEIPAEVVAALIEQGKPESGDDLPAAPPLTLETTAKQQAILDVLSSSDHPLKLTTICQKAGIPADSHARMSIKKLVEDGRVRHFPETHRYALTCQSGSD